MTTRKKFLRSCLVFITTSVLVFGTGIFVGAIVVLINKYTPELKYFSNNLLLILWSIYWGLSAFGLLFKNIDGKYEFRKEMAFYTFFYGLGIYLALLKGEAIKSANIFAIISSLSLLLVITAPPFLAKYLKPLFSKRTT